MDLTTDSEELRLLAESIRTAMGSASGAKLDVALTDLGWHDMLDEIPDIAIPLVFRLLGETGAHAPVLNDVLLRAAGRAPGIERTGALSRRGARLHLVAGVAYRTAQSECSAAW